MRYIFFFLVLPSLTFGQYAAKNMSLHARWSDPAVIAEPTYGIKYNGIWGYSAAGREYAIIGSTGGVYFIDVTNPSQPQQVDFVKGRRSQTIWREIKTYNNYAYLISDDAVPNSLQIVDLSYLPDSVHLVHDSDSIFARAHTIFVENDKLYCASVTKANGTYYSMAVYSLADPEKPLFLRALNQDYQQPSTVHDMWVHNDTIYASGGYSGLFIYKFENNTFSLLNSLTSYPDQGYNHSSILTPDKQRLIFMDEVPEDLGIKILNVTDFSNLEVESIFKSNVGATPHNPYWYKNRLVVAYYKDGVQVYDITDPINPVNVAFFDTYPQNGTSYTGNPYEGCWGAYTDLPSGNIIASDTKNGLFVLNVHSAATELKDYDLEKENFVIHPNPFTNTISVKLNIEKEGIFKIEICDITGKILLSIDEKLKPEASNLIINTEALPSGIYILKVSGTGVNSIQQKLVKANN